MPKPDKKRVDTPACDEPISRPMVRAMYPCSAKSFAMRVTDDANAPRFVPGDSVVVDPELAVEAGDMVVAIVTKKKTPVLRRAHQIKAGRKPAYRLEALNPEAPTFQIGGGEPGYIIGVVSEHSQPRRPREDAA